MKLLHVTFQVQYTDHVEAILEAHQLREYVRYPQIAGMDSDGKHTYSQAFPGHMTCIQAQILEEKVKDVLNALQDFREEKKAHHHLQALVLPVEQTLPALTSRDS